MSLMNRKRKPNNGNGGTLSPRGGPQSLSGLRSEFDRLFDRFLGNWPVLHGDHHWGLEVKEQDDSVVVKAEAPGFEVGDFDIQMKGNQLVLKAEKTNKEGKERGYREESRHELYESVTLPQGINTENAEARYHSGVLTVAFPKTPEWKAKRIAVKES